ncbi:MULTISPECIES: ABC transporter permease [Alphaproteobacteria]|uniref:Peptide ABC transporter permease n=2 Tax=Alphaproteobacteria TaxID=28211 RepID=A0A512HEG5_9HYPH|nr:MULTISPECIES: FtsX-like permease family protein [Alphaproteobacteria]GEO83851.1 peptide ABC transporter permease [Ciceribacter naphthalenivorans]GLR21271.1 peptide ABC transporter permease [Ciceribacter naphthalenivorans]GLT04127.1 peptide ABC transporter permease [Sphingomonas psychrolutea]
MSMLDRKLYRDLLRLWAQVLAVALVMACGVATIIIAIGSYRSLEETRDVFYERYRFANLFAEANRAPLHLRDRIASIEGIGGLELRIVKYVMLDIEGMVEPATGVAVSLPDSGQPGVNRLYIRSGRLPEPGRGDEAAVLESFAKAHRLREGSRFAAVMNGRKQMLTVTGIVLSPEYIYTIGPGDMVPDPRRFGVFYMSRKALEGMFDMGDAFNNVVLSTLRGTNPEVIKAAVDALLEPYGGRGAYGREDQISDTFLANELDELRAMAAVIPPIFLFVAAFLVNMILTRLITLEREQIGLLKALGYRDTEVAWHYIKLTAVIALIGVAIGFLAGNWTGREMTRLYARFFSFPFLIFRESFDLYAMSAGICLAAAFAGAIRAIWSVVALPAAVAMLPPAPLRFRSLFKGYRRGPKFLSQLTIMAFRQIVRAPVRAALTSLGVSFSVALLVVSMFSGDAVSHMVEEIFFRMERQDASLHFDQDRPIAALDSVRQLPGVLRAEPFRAISVTLRNRHSEKDLTIFGVEAETDLGRIMDADMRPIPPPPNGILLIGRVADALGLKVGDMVEVELVERDHRKVMVPVTGISQSLVGTDAYMHIEALDRLVGDGRRISGARVSLDALQRDALFAEVKNTPALAFVMLIGLSRERFRATIEENILMIQIVYMTLAVIVAFGLIYNSARIQLSERARELASLRVLGFTPAEVSRVLMTELAVVILAAQPLGWVLGYAFSKLVTEGIESDLFRIPFFINQSTFAIASLVVLGASLASALIVRRRIDELDLIAVLKSRE